MTHVKTQQIVRLIHQTQFSSCRSEMEQILMSYFSVTRWAWGSGTWVSVSYLMGAIEKESEHSTYVCLVQTKTEKQKRKKNTRLSLCHQTNDDRLDKLIWVEYDVFGTTSCSNYKILIKAFKLHEYERNDLICAQIGSAASQNRILLQAHDSSYFPDIQEIKLIISNLHILTHANKFWRQSVLLRNKYSQLAPPVIKSHSFFF